MYRLVIGLLLGYLGYKIVQKVFKLGKPPLPSQNGSSQVEAEELVEDPVCKTFIPRRNALKASKEGRDYYFCSEGCRKRFMK